MKRRSGSKPPTADRMRTTRPNSDAKPTQAGHPVGEVDLVGGLELVLLELVHDPERHAGDLFGGKPLPILQRHQAAVDSEHRRKTGLQVDVGSAPAQSDLQDLVELHGAPSLTPSLQNKTEAHSVCGLPSRNKTGAEKF